MTKLDEFKKRYIAYQESYNKEAAVVVSYDSSSTSNASANKTITSRRTKNGDSAHTPEQIKIKSNNPTDTDD